MGLRRSCSTRSIIGIVIILAAASPVLAQDKSAADAGAGPPARIGNIYDHADHQPTEAELGAGGVGSSSSTSRRQVDEEVKQLLETTDKLDKRSEQQEQDYLGGSSPGPKDGR